MKDITLNIKDLKLKNKFTVYIIHHTHTDIGYTDRQEKILRYHTDFIKQAVDILNSGKYKNFKWICEGFSGVEEFLNSADKATVKKFEKYVLEDKISLSGSYFNLTEAIAKEPLDAVLKRVFEYGKTLGKKIDCALSADINGFSWGYIDSLYNNGIENLMTSLNIHHGLYPLFKMQTPFFWESPAGKKILVWAGEHYNLGNAMGFAPGYSNNYMFGREETDSDLTVLAAERLPGYIKSLQDDGYAYDFVPLGISGVFSDNAPPNAQIAAMADAWNKKYGDIIELKMASLNDFFEHARKHADKYPTYKGDWTDWWADGIGSTPAETALFRNAQRKYKLAGLLDNDGKIIDKKLKMQAEDNLLLFAEHTWGYSASITEPWNPMTKSLDLRKASYAVNADISSSQMLDAVLKAHGEAELRPSMELKYKVVNPYPYKYADIVRLYLNGWESSDAFTVTDKDSNKELSYQIDTTARGKEICVFTELEAHEEKIIIVAYKKNMQGFYLNENSAAAIAEVTNDPFYKRGMYANSGVMSTPYYNLTFGGGGIEDIKDNQGVSLIRKDSLYKAFMPLYEITRGGSPDSTRSQMSRNRCNIFTERFTSRCTGINTVDSGEIFVRSKINFELEGTEHGALVITGYKNMPRLDVAVRFNKMSKWEPENIYMPLPFTASGEEELWIEKSGAVLRPGIDQIPGTCGEFYSIQDGLCLLGKNKSVTVAVKDAPLIKLGNPEWKEIDLCDEKNHGKNKQPVFSWLMNNFWETNFRATLGGFYEFNYSLMYDGLQSKEKCAEQCRSVNTGLVAIRI